MGDKGQSEDRSEAAAAWLARLNQRSVSSEELQQFYAWRRDPENAAAYAEAERIWKGARALGDDRDIALAVRQALERPRRSAALGERGARGRGLLVGAGLLALLLVALALYLSRSPTYETAVGEQRLVRLEDGSRLRLNTDTSVRIDYSSDRREVELARGEALFEVRHDPTRPFIVRSDDLSVRAIGTRFDVRSDGAVRVALIEGAIAVTEAAAGAKPERLGPGEAFILAPDGTTEVARVDLDVVTSWTTGRMIFRETPLGEAIAEVNRYSDRKIELRSEALRTLRVDGTFETGDIDAFVSAVTALFPLKAEKDPRGNILLRPA